MGRKCGSGLDLNIWANYVPVPVVSNTCEMTKLIQNNFLPFYRHHLSKTVRNVSTNIENINFSDYQTVFKYKSTSDLLRNLCLLRLDKNNDLTLLVGGWAYSAILF